METLPSLLGFLVYYRAIHQAKIQLNPFRYIRYICRRAKQSRSYQRGSFFSRVSARICNYLQQLLVSRIILSSDSGLLNCKGIHYEADVGAHLELYIIRSEWKRSFICASYFFESNQSLAAEEIALNSALFMDVPIWGGTLQRAEHNPTTMSKFVLGELLTIFQR